MSLGDVIDIIIKIEPCIKKLYAMKKMKTLKNVYLNIPIGLKKIMLLISVELVPNLSDSLLL